METRCKTCKTTIDFSSCYFVDNDNVAVCKDCYNTKKYDITKNNGGIMDNNLISKEKFEEFVEVQNMGLYNMLDPRARDLTTLTKEEWFYIVKNYEKLEEDYNV